MASTSVPSRTERRQAKRQDPDRVSFGRNVAWSTSHASQAGSVIILGYFAIYCTDTLGLNPAIVGGLLLASKLVDAVGVLLSGYIVDRSPNTRWGKARPFDLAIVGVWIFAAIMFSTPAGFSDVGKYIWVFASYLMVSAIFTPLFLANQPLYLARSFVSRGAITKVTSFSGIIIGLGGVIVGISFPIFAQSAGKSPAAWAALVVAYAIPLAILGVVRFLTIREIHDTESSQLPRVTFRDIRKVLATNPYLWGVAGIQLVASIGGGAGGLTYYYRYIVGNIALQGILGALAILLIPLFIAVPALIRRFSVSKLIAVAGVFGVVGASMYGFVGSNIPLLIVAAVLTAASSLPVAFLLPILIIDNSTFNEWKGNRRLESVGGSITAFAMNAGAGVAAGIAGFVLTTTGYNGKFDTQTPAAIGGIVAITAWIPAAMSVVIVVIALFYNRFERRLPTITKEIDLRRVTSGMTPLITPAGSTVTANNPFETGTVDPRDPK